MMGVKLDIYTVSLYLYDPLVSGALIPPRAIQFPGPNRSFYSTMNMV